jgi:four helix bundle protein
MLQKEVRLDHFEHERLDVYKAILDFLGVADDIIAHLPRGRGHLSDQLQRASTSILLNLAEGAGEFAALEKARLYRISRRSATECAAILDICRTRKLVDPAPLGAGRDLLLRIVAMLTRMILKCAERSSG